MLDLQTPLNDSTLPMWKIKVLAIAVFFSTITYASAENRAARLDSSRWTAVVIVNCRGGNDAFDAGLGALIRDDLQAISNLDVVDGRDLLIASRAIGDASEPSRETVKKAGIDAAVEVKCQVGQGRLNWEGTLYIPASDTTIHEQGGELPLRQSGQVAFQLISSLFSRARDRKLLPPTLYTQSDQSLLGRLVRPQHDTMVAYGRGILAEKTNSFIATQHLREALSIDPDFHPAYARLFYTVYLGQINPRLAEADILTQMKVRLNSIEAVWIAKAFYDLAIASRDRGWISTAETYHNRSLVLLKSGGKEKSLLSSFNLSRIGDAYITLSNRMSALYNIQTAREILESQGLDQNVFYALNLIRLATLYSLDGKTDLAMWLLDRAGQFDRQNSLFTSFIHANAGTILMKMGTPEKARETALDAFRKARSILKERNLSHSSMYLMLLVQEANALRSTGDTRAAEKLYEAVITGSKILGLDGTQLHIDALAGMGMTNLARGETISGQNYLRMAYFLQLRLGPRPPDDIFSISQLPIQSRLGFMEEEQTRVASYTGAFYYNGHARVVQSRTYAGRLDDTNVLLKDLLDTARIGDAGLNALRKALLGAGLHTAGDGIHFIDIGPAMANLISPGVTAVSIARDFPSMNVIALDLPEQVEIFRRQVHPDLRHRVLEFPNFYVLSANGISPLKVQLAENFRWFEPKKPRRQIQSGDPIIIRAANSIDIYENWQKNEEAMLRIAVDYQENPVLYLFNRSILFKGAHSSQFSVIGLLSRAGFDHMYQTFDRGGENAYTILDL